MNNTVYALVRSYTPIKKGWGFHQNQYKYCICTNHLRTLRLVNLLRTMIMQCEPLILLILCIIALSLYNGLDSARHGVNQRLEELELALACLTTSEMALIAQSPIDVAFEPLWSLQVHAHLRLQ